MEKSFRIRADCAVDCCTTVRFARVFVSRETFCSAAADRTSRGVYDARASKILSVMSGIRHPQVLWIYRASVETESQGCLERPSWTLPNECRALTLAAAVPQTPRQVGPPAR